MLGNDNANNVDVGETLTVTPASGTTTGGGTYSIDAAGAYTYTPGANFNGIDTFTYTVNDATTSDTGLVSITVSAVNDPVVAVDDTNTAVEDGPTINGTVLGNDNANNVDVGETLTVTPASGTTTGGGTYSIDAAGAYTYTPGANFNGIDTFTYTVNDATTSDTGLVSITVSAVNDAPTADDFAGTVAEDFTNVPVDLTTLTDDVDGDALTYTITTELANGTLTETGTPGIYTYTPDADFTGTDFFTYTVNSTAGSPTPPPCGHRHPDTGDTATITAITQGANGSAVVNTDGTFTYTPQTPTSPAPTPSPTPSPTAPCPTPAQSPFRSPRPTTHRSPWMTASPPSRTPRRPATC